MCALPIEERVICAVEQFPSVAMTTALGYSGMILLWIKKQANLSFPVYFIDTGYHFQETMEFLEVVKQLVGKDLEVVAANTRHSNDKIYQTDPDHCCKQHKVEVFNTLKKSHEVWLHALRKDQSETRAGLDFVMVDRDGKIRVHPLLDWTRDQCWDYIEVNNIPSHPLHKKGYMSIGCAPCTTPVSSWQHERDGRWVHRPEKTECGLHGHIG